MAISWGQMLISQANRETTRRFLQVGPTALERVLTSFWPVGFLPIYVLQLYVQNLNMWSRCLGSDGNVSGPQVGTRARVAISTLQAASTLRSGTQPMSRQKQEI